MDKSNLALVMVLLVLLAASFYLSTINDDLRQKVSDLSSHCEQLEQELAADTLMYSNTLVVFDAPVETQFPIVFNCPVTFDSTVVFRDSVAFGYGGVSFVEPPTAAYD
jgi:hypothetical protein